MGASRRLVKILGPAHLVCFLLAAILGACSGASPADLFGDAGTIATDADAATTVDATMDAVDASGVPVGSDAGPLDADASDATDGSADASDATDGSADANDAAPSLFAVSGTIDGLAGTTAVLVNNGTSPLVISADGAFSFPRELADGAAYLVTVLTAPAGHVCTVENQGGAISGADVTNVAVHCPADSTLSALTISAGPISPAFAPALLAYTASAVLPGLFSTSTPTTITATTHDPGAHLTIAGAAAVSGSPSGPLVLFYGPNPIDVTVTAADGVTKTHYTVVLSDAASDYLKASNTSRTAYFGTSVAISGDTIAVGTIYEGSNATGINGNEADNSAPSGAVYVFTRTGAVWSQQAYIKASNTSLGMAFGSSVALSGDTLAVGADHEASNAMGVNGDQTDASAFGAGAVYVFTRSGVTWSQQAYVKASNPRSSSNFGSSVALSGDTLAVGALQESSNATGVNGDQTNTGAYEAGAVYVFRRTGTAWAQEAYIKASYTPGFGYFGRSVALSGDTLAVGSDGEQSNATGVNGDQVDRSLTTAGAVFVFTRSGTTWSQEAYLKASNTRTNGAFGFSVALSGNTLAVGAYGESSNAIGIDGDQTSTSALQSGAVYIFTRTGVTWSQEAYLKASNTAQGALFGFSVALVGDTLAVGAEDESGGATGLNGDQSNASGLAGAAYVFARTGTMWSQKAYVKSSNTASLQGFGCLVALSSDTLAVGAYGESSSATGVNGNQADTSVYKSGAVYVFR